MRQDRTSPAYGPARQTRWAPEDQGFSRLYPVGTLCAPFIDAIDYEENPMTNPKGEAIVETGTYDDTGARQREAHKVTGDRVITKLKELIHEGNVRHVVIKNEEGRTLIEFPVAVGVAGAVLLPVWAAVGAIAAMVSNCSIEVEREQEDEPSFDETP